MVETRESKEHLTEFRGTLPEGVLPVEFRVAVQCSWRWFKWGMWNAPRGGCSLSPLDPSFSGARKELSEKAHPDPGDGVLVEVVRHLVQRIGRVGALRKGSFHGVSWEAKRGHHGRRLSGSIRLGCPGGAALSSFPRKPGEGHKKNPQSEGGLSRDQRAARLTA